MSEEMAKTKLVIKNSLTEVEAMAHAAIATLDKLGETEAEVGLVLRAFLTAMRRQFVVLCDALKEEM